MLRCKPGDLAVVIRPAPQEPRALGLFVTVICREGYGSYTRFGLSASEPLWLVEAGAEYRMSTGNLLRRFCVPDALLRPIRPGDEEDEALRIESIPSTDKVTS